MSQRLVKTEDSPPEDQIIRTLCSPNHVGTWGRYYLDVNLPSLTAYESLHAKRAVVIVPGGGGLHLAWDTEGLDAGEAFKKMGVAAYVLAYRVPVKNWEAGSHLMDVQRAISHVRSLGYKHVGVFGGSFGGGAGCDASMATERLYDYTDEVDKQNFVPDFAVLLYPGKMTTPGPGALSHQSPPTFLVVAEDDPCTGPPIAREYFHKTLLGRPEIVALPHNSENKHELYVYEKGMHGFAMCNRYEAIKDYPVCKWPTNMLTWLNKHFPP